MWYLHIWSTLILAMQVMVALALETDIVLVRSLYLGYDGNHAPRQASLSAPAITTAISYSPVVAPTPAPRPPVASNPAIVISFLPPSTTTTPPTSTFLSTSLSSSQDTITTTPITTPTHSLPPTASPTSSAQVTTARPPFKLIYLIPSFAVVGILLGGLIGWVLYRCMTRKPHFRGDDGALLIGPRYVGIDEPEHHHVRDHHIGRGEATQMKNLPGTNRPSPNFRWPSFNEKPAFDPVRGFHVPDLNDKDPILPPFVTRPDTDVNARTKSTRTTRTSRSTRTFKSTRPTTAGPSRNVLASPASNTTSLALLELYESDEEEETRRKAREVPWESLRHKSIKRGIIEQVKKEGKWMDSIRGMAGSSVLGSRSKAIMEEGNVLLGVPDADDSMEVDSYIGRRRKYPIPDSDPFADSPTKTHSISPKKRPCVNSRRTDSTTAMFPTSTEPHGVGFQIIPESAATTPNHSPRRTFAWLKKDDASNAPERLTRLPTPIIEGYRKNRSESRSQSSRSTSPIKRTSNNDVHISQVPRRDVLTRSPAQIMSPPLHSQMCFTPIPASSAKVLPPTSRDYYHSRSLSPTKPLIVSSASKGKKKVQSPRNLHRFPKSLSSTNTAVVPDVRSPRHEVSQGRMLQRSDSATTNHAKQVARRSKRSGSIVTTEGQADMLEDPIKKVERIMASSWSARDLGQGGMRNLSPTGFGRRL